MSLSQWELFWWRTKLFTQPQPKYYAYQEELRNNPLIERSINLITLVRILLIVVMIPTEGIWNPQWNSKNMLTRLASGVGERAPRGRADAWAPVKRWERGVIVSLISEDKCWQIQQSLKACYRRRTAVRGGRGLPEPDKTFIFELLLVRVLCVISHCRIPLHPPRGQTKQQSGNFQGLQRPPPPHLPRPCVWLTPSTDSRLHAAVVKIHTSQFTSGLWLDFSHDRLFWAI